MIEPDMVRLSSPESLHFKETDWMGRGLCAGSQDKVWDYDAGTDGSDRAAKHASAIAICQECPVLALCATYAEQNDLVGVWGGKCRDDGTLACGSCRRDHQLSLSTELEISRRERAAKKERERVAAMTPEQKAAKNARRYATPELREAARVRHLAWKSKRTAEKKAAAKIVDSERYYRNKAASC